MNYDPDHTPLFIGLSVDAIVHVKEEPTGPDAGRVLQPNMSTTAPTASTKPSTQPESTQPLAGS